MGAGQGRHPGQRCGPGGGDACGPPEHRYVIAQSCPSCRNLPLLVPPRRPGHSVFASGQQILRSREASLKEGEDRRHATHGVPQGRAVLRERLWAPRAWRHRQTHSHGALSAASLQGAEGLWRTRLPHSSSCRSLLASCWSLLACCCESSLLSLLPFPTGLPPAVGSSLLSKELGITAQAHRLSEKEQTRSQNLSQRRDWGPKVIQSKFFS